MRQNNLIMLLVVGGLLASSGCTSQKGLEVDYPGYEQVVSELQPTLKWQAVSGSDVTYDIFLRVKDKDKREKADYYKEGLAGTTHKIEIKLKPNTMYQWSVRSNSSGDVSEWSKREVKAFVGVAFHQQSRYMRFLTPAAE